jgi:hypothetical protein
MRCFTNKEVCVVFPHRSTPSNTINVPRWGGEDEDEEEEDNGVGVVDDFGVMAFVMIVDAIFIPIINRSRGVGCSSCYGNNESRRRSDDDR